MKKQMQKILLGNEAIAQAIVESGCSLAASYPGTPASEIIETVAHLKKRHNLRLHVEWSVNEKCAFEVALANSYMGCRSAVAMKQVGLNVALDPLMSSAYTGVVGGFLVCAADDPGPHSSQTEQDSRMLALFAKIPVFDPSSPEEAYQCVSHAFELSEKYSIPVMLRPTTRVCHARQNINPQGFSGVKRKAMFSKNPVRWAATPRHRLTLHQELNKKILAISKLQAYRPIRHTNKPTGTGLCIVASGVAYAYVADILEEYGLFDKTDLYKVAIPYPLHKKFAEVVLRNYKKILVLEETYPVIEMQISDRSNVMGRLSGHVPQAGEMTPDSIDHVIRDFFTMPKRRASFPMQQQGRRPSLCPGCPHRAAFFAIKKTFPKAIYPGDIGCYTLGINLGAVDTCLCMGASINNAAGFYHAITTSGSDSRQIIATIGDSTFLHAGIPALINALYTGARFILVILDNSTTAMTGNQPTAGTGLQADGSQGKSIKLDKLLEGCGVSYLKIIDPYNIPALLSELKDAEKFTRAQDGGVAVVVARHPCLMQERPMTTGLASATDACTGCHYCVTNFECPALSIAGKRCVVDERLCIGCGVCVHVCPLHALTILPRKSHGIDNG